MTVHRIGPYEIERLLDSGGMAELFLARKPLGRGYKLVVVKRMRTELIDDDRFVEMFLREARILAQLSHPNIVQIFDLAETDDGQLYLAMEYLEGLSVQQLAVRAWRARRALPCELVVRLMLEVARGLDYVHRQRGPRGEELGLVHRDVAPDNIFLLRDGLVKLVDFGIAKGAQTALLTATGELKGKVPFMAPELLDEQPIDGRADLWALGISVYWLLAGCRPFRGKNEVQIMRAILREEPPRLSTVNPQVPSWLSDLVAALLEKDRARRVQRGAEIEDVIMKHAGGLLDRDRDVAFVNQLLEVPGDHLDDVTNPVPAAHRDAAQAVPRALEDEASLPVTAQVPRPITLAPPASNVPRPHARQDPFAGDTEVNQAPRLAPTKPEDDDVLFDDARPPPAAATRSAAPFGSEAASPVGDSSIVGIVDPSDEEFAPPTTVDVKRGAGRTPMPKAMKVDMPVGDEPRELDETQRLTESQVGIERDDDG